MPGFNAQSIVAKVRTGNAVSILVGDTPVGFGQTSGQSLSYNLSRFFGVGSSKPMENSQLRYEPTITLDAFQLTDAGLKYFGYETTWLKILTNTELNISVIDNNGNILLTFAGATAQDYSSSISANSPITENVTFAALDILDEDGASILNNGVDALLVNVVGTAASVLVNGI